MMVLKNESNKVFKTSFANAGGQGSGPRLKPNRITVAIGLPGGNREITGLIQSGVKRGDGVPQSVFWKPYSLRTLTISLELDSGR